MGLKTPLYQQHVDAGARIVDFGGWDMPLNYGSQVDEHHSVRTRAGVFDVSHMTVVDVSGKDARAFLQNLLANNVARLKQAGKALYSCMLNPDGGVVDDGPIALDDPLHFQAPPTAMAGGFRAMNPSR